MREVKRLDSISRSPVYSSIGEALAGLATIRAFRCEDRLAMRNADLVDGSVIMSLVNMSMNRCAGVGFWGTQVYPLGSACLWQLLAVAAGPELMALQALSLSVAGLH